MPYCRGTSPSHAAKARPLLKSFASATLATSAVAVIGPDAGNGLQPLRGFVYGVRALRVLAIVGEDLLIESADVITEIGEPARRAKLGSAFSVSSSTSDRRARRR